MSNASEAIVNEFLVESFENLSNINDELTMFEKDSTNSDLLNSIYRKVHTLKGSASFLGFKKLESITHASETLLDHLREGTISVSEELFDLLLESFDVCIVILKIVESKGNEGSEDYTTLVGKLVAVLEKKFVNQKVSLEDNVEIRPVLEANNKSIEIKSVEPMIMEKISTPKDEPALREKKEIIPAEKKVEEEPFKNEAPKASAAPLGDSTIRVNVNLLDKIMNVVGELVLNRNQILQFSKENDDSELNRLSQQLNVITTELQTDIMTTRMQPVGVVFNKFERIVRDLARSQKKKIKLEIIGKDTELDKTLLEMIKDPMTHLIRNAADHGVEIPEKRLKAGKSEEGKLSIKAYHEGGQVIVEIKDDGNGIDPQVILNKAISKGLVGADEAEKLSEANILQFIFSPGFSTAEKVTNISGRGVGMDVVRSNIEKIGGKVDVSSEVGHGTTFKLKIPLTLAIVPALVVHGGDQTFALAQKNLVELVLLEGDKDKQIERLHGHEFFRLRGELIPIFRLNKSLGFEAKDSDDELINIVVMKAEGKVYGLVVDEVLDTQEIVVKPLSPRLKDQAVYAGATIMGDGRVALIIDAFGFYNMVDKSGAKSDLDSSDFENDTRESNYGDLQEMLLCELGDGRVYGIPLCLVNRLEEFSFDDIEWSGKQPLMKYREIAMPLLNLENMLHLDCESTSMDRGDVDKEILHVVVFYLRDQYFGIAVKNIMDIATTYNQIESENADREGLMGTLYIDDKLITVLDIHTLIDFLKIGKKTTQPHHQKTIKGKVLLVEDSPLYRRVSEDFLTQAGLDVVVAINGLDGLQKLREEKGINLVLTDIEMPEMNGWELASKIRSLDSELKDLPIVALSTRVSDKDRAKGVAAGFSHHLEKLDKEEVLETLSGYLG